MNDKLIIRPRLSILLIFCVDIIWASVVITCVHNAIFAEDYILMVVAAVLFSSSLFWIFYLIRNSKRSISYMKYYKLLLTNDECLYTDGNNKTIKFRLQDIVQLNDCYEKGKLYLEIRLCNPARIIRIQKSYFLKNLKDIIPFVEHNLQKSVYVEME